MNFYVCAKKVPPIWEEVLVLLKHTEESSKFFTAQNIFGFK